jgi:hypothetical protein
MTTNEKLDGLYAGDRPFVVSRQHWRDAGPGKSHLAVGSASRGRSFCPQGLAEGLVCVYILASLAGRTEARDYGPRDTLQSEADRR